MLTMKISADAAAKYWYILKTANIRHYKIRGQKQTTSQASIIKSITLVDVPEPKPGYHFSTLSRAILPLLR